MTSPGMATGMFINLWPHYAMICDASNVNPNPCDQCISFGSEDGKEIYYGAIFQSWTKVACTVHSAIFEPRKLTKGALWHIFYYPFVQLDCKRLFAAVPSDNIKALDLNAKFGFKRVTVIPNAYPDADCVVMGLERENCKWLNYQPRHIFEPRKVA